MVGPGGAKRHMQFKCDRAEWSNAPYGEQGTRGREISDAHRGGTYRRWGVRRKDLRVGSESAFMGSTFFKMGSRIGSTLGRMLLDGPILP
jgi:hypothetical protein